MSIVCGLYKTNQHEVLGILYLIPNISMNRNIDRNNNSSKTIDKVFFTDMKHKRSVFNSIYAYCLIISTICMAGKPKEALKMKVSKNDNSMWNKQSI